MATDPERLVGVAQLQIPGLEELWRETLYVTEEVAVETKPDDLIPTEILINPHQLALALDEREAGNTEK
jgi:hypothetical protein